MIHLHRSRSAAIRLLLLAALSATGLVVGTSAPALAQTSGTWTLTGSMKGAREGQTATLLPNGQVLIAGGIDGTTVLSSAELYNPATGKWSSTGAMNVPRADQTATLLPNGEVLVAGGWNTPSGAFCLFNYLSSAELYNPATGKWTLTGTMSAPRAGQTATLLPNGQVLVAGGVTQTSPTNCAEAIYSSAELYNPATGTWSLTGSMNAPRDLFTATLLGNGQVLAAGGDNNVDPFNHSLSSAELYNPGTGTWTLTGSLNTARAGHHAVLLSNGEVLVVDGEDVSSLGTFELNSTEVYDPATGKWTTTGNTFHAGRAGFSVTLLGTGKVLIAGGEAPTGKTNTILSEAELYDPSTATTALTASMNVPRNDQSATLLPNGQVLAAGGETETSNGKFIDTSSAELYTP